MITILEAITLKCLNIHWSATSLHLPGDFNVVVNRDMRMNISMSTQYVLPCMQQTVIDCVFWYLLIMGSNKLGSKHHHGFNVVAYQCRIPLLVTPLSQCINVSLHFMLMISFKFSRCQHITIGSPATIIKTDTLLAVHWTASPTDDRKVSVWHLCFSIKKCDCFLHFFFLFCHRVQGMEKIAENSWTVEETQHWQHQSNPSWQPMLINHQRPIISFSQSSVHLEFLSERGKSCSAY